MADNLVLSLIPQSSQIIFRRHKEVENNKTNVGVQILNLKKEGKEMLANQQTILQNQHKFFKDEG